MAAFFILNEINLIVNQNRYKPMQFTADKIFPVGVPVTGKNLIGREEEIKEITSLLNIGQSVILIAPRKYGKTSLILEVLHRLKKEKNYTGFVDLFAVITKKNLAEKIVDAVLLNKKMKHSVKQIKENLVYAMKSIEIKHAVNDFEFILGFSDPKTDENSILEDSLDFPENYAKKNKNQMFFAFDEFGDLLKLNGDSLVKLMRARFQMHQNVTYLFSGSQESLMVDLFADKKSAFFRFGRIIHLSPIPSDAFQKYIESQFSKAGIDMDRAAIDWILMKTQCHPYYTQLICQICFLSVKGTKTKASIEDAKRALRSAILFEKSYFEEVENTLMTNKYLLLLTKHLAYGSSSVYQFEGLDKQYIYKLLVQLQNRGIVKRIEKGNYVLLDPLLKEYFILREDGII